MRLLFAALSVIAVVALVWLFYPQETDPDLSKLSEAEVKALHTKHAHAIGSKIPNMKRHALDLSDRSHRLYFLTSLHMAGITRDRAPQLYKTIDGRVSDDRAAVGGLLSAFAQSNPTCSDPATTGGDMVADNSVNYIAGINYDSSQNYNSAAVSSTEGGTIATSMTLGQYDETNGNLIGTPTSLYDTTGKTFYSMVNSGGSTADEAYALLNEYRVDNNGHPHGPCVMRLSTRSLQADLTNTAPTQSGNNWDPIKICINRNPGSFGCQYGPYDVQNPNQMVSPVQGSVTYPGAVTMENGKPKDAQVTLIVTREQVPDGDVAGGGCTAWGPNSDAFFSATTTTWSNGNTVLNYNFQPTYFNSESCDFKNHDQLVYTLIIQVLVDNAPMPVTVTSIKTKPPNAQPSSDYVLIPYLQIQSGCLAPGTEVTLADGSTFTVDDYDIEGKMVLADAQGRRLTVAAHGDGHETGSMVVLKTEAGHTVTLTQNHPVPTPEGVMRARDLQPGDRVQTLDGPAALTSVEREDYDGPVYNLSVGQEGERFTDDTRTFFAGGILVGDQNMQSNLVRAHQQKPENRLKELPSEWHQDYKNFHG